ncbi:MAG TPA: RnfABCDGE type electron transport complex subunit D [bacterium]|nr:RnfABCDGE type electron transport complex subunit D [bacterium]
MADATKPSLADHARGSLHALPFFRGRTKPLPLHAKFSWAFLPLALTSVYLFGWRCAFLLALAYAVGWVTAAAFSIVRRRPMDPSFWITALLFGLTLPAHVPWWLVVIGVAVGQLFGKEVFGGFGRNVFNPALVGRAFVTISFPTYFAGYWWKPFWGGIGGFARWAPDLTAADAVTTATPLAAFKGSGVQGPLGPMLWGDTGGAMGETAAVLLVLLGIYLLARKIVNWRTPLAVLGAASLAALVLHFLWPGFVPDVPFTLAGGGLLFGALFFATDPVSAPATNGGRWLMGALIGVLVVIIRAASSFSGGVFFAILFANTFTPLVDSLIKERQKRKRGV